MSEEWGDAAVADTEPDLMGRLLDSLERHAESKRQRAEAIGPDRQRRPAGRGNHGQE